MDYRLELKVKNNNILKKMEECGYKSVGHFCRVNKRTQYQSVIGQFVNLKKSPLNKKGQFHPAILWICKILKCDMSDLFTEHQMHSTLETNKRILEIKEAEAIHLCFRAESVLLPDEILEKKENEQLLSQIIKTLAGREEFVIKRIFGLDGHAEHTHREVGQLMGISRERVRQIEAKALWKLRHDSRKKRLDDPSI